MPKRAFPHEKILSLQDNPLFCDLDLLCFLFVATVKEDWALASFWACAVYISGVCLGNFDNLDLAALQSMVNFRWVKTMSQDSYSYVIVIDLKNYLLWKLSAYVDSTTAPSFEITYFYGDESNKNGTFCP